MQQPTDSALLALFENNSQQAWELFINKHSALILSCLRRSEGDYDRVMDRFVYICEKLSEHDYQRLRKVQFLGDSGEITPWLRQVVRRLAINFAQSRGGRRRLLRPIARLESFDQKVFEAYFWQRQTPLEISESLRAELRREIRLVDVIDSQERIFRNLGTRRIWRLLIDLGRRQPAMSLTCESEDDPLEWKLESSVADPEEELLRDEGLKRLRDGLAVLAPRDRLLLRLRYEEEHKVKDVGRILAMGDREVRSALRSARRRLRRVLRCGGTESAVD